MKRQPIRIGSKRADSPSIIERSVALARSVCLLVVFFFATSSALATSGDEATLQGRTVVPLAAERPMVATLPPVLYRSQSRWPHVAFPGHRRGVKGKGPTVISTVGFRGQRSRSPY